MHTCNETLSNINRHKKMSFPQENIFAEKEKSSRIGITTLSARIAAMVSFIVALAIFQTNDVSFQGVSFTYKSFHSYKYGFWVGLIGLAYTVLQIPMAMHYMLRKKHLINSPAFLKFDFYADKMAAFVVATAAGAAFGTTMDMETVSWKKYGDDVNDKVHSFLTVSYLAAAFLLVASMSCWISSVHSSLALTHKIVAQQF